MKDGRGEEGTINLLLQLILLLLLIVNTVIFRAFYAVKYYWRIARRILM